MKHRISFYFSFLLVLLVTLNSCEHEIVQSDDAIFQAEQTTLQLPESLADNIHEYEQQEKVLNLLISKPKIATSEISEQLDYLESTDQFPEFSSNKPMEASETKLDELSEDALNIIDGAMNIVLNKELTRESGNDLESYYLESKHLIEALPKNEKTLVVYILEDMYFSISSPSFRKYARLNGYNPSSKFKTPRWLKCAFALIKFKSATAACLSGIIPSCVVAAYYAAQIAEHCSHESDPCDDPIVNPCCGVECPPGQVCFGGNCMSDPCAGVNCPDGQECINVAGVAHCKDRCYMVNCPPGTWCVDGICTSYQPGDCNIDDDCDDGDCCNNGVCGPC